MKHSGWGSLLFLLLLFTSGVYAQTAQSPTSYPATTSTVKPASDNTPVAASTATLPPEKAGPVRIKRFETAPVIDGQLNDDAWKQAVVLSNFLQIQPGDNIEPSKPTEVLLGYDAQHLYIAFRAHDEAGKVRATVAKRDSIFNDDYVGCFLDTFNDKRRAYELFFNPLGVQQDGILTEGRGEDFSVDIVMQSRGSVTDDGYVVEVAIPFKSLRYDAGEGKLWGVHFFRRIKRFNNELNSWMPIAREKSGRFNETTHVTEDLSGALNQSGHIIGLEKLWTGRVIEIIPSFTVSETGKQVKALTPDDSGRLLTSSRFINKPLGFDPGLNAKFLLSPDTSLDLAINPDFAQVEADQTVVTANQRFPIFFEEKRPFFLEGIDIFQTPLTPLHTRAIIDPDVAVKLTGKRDRNTFGLILASDNAPGNFSEEERNDPTLRPSIERFLDKNAYIGVLRLKRDIGKESNIGLIGTTYSFIERHNHVLGFDGRFRLSPQRVFTFQLLGTSSRRFFFDPDAGRNIYRTGNGVGYFYNLTQAGRNLNISLRGEGRTRFYRADVGFTRRANNNNHRLFLRYRSNPNPKAKLVSWGWNDQTVINFDFQGRLQRWETYPQIIFNFQRQTFIAFYGLYGHERIYEEEFGRKRTATRTGAFSGHSERGASYTGFEVEFGTTISKKYSFYSDSYYKWNTFDFDFGGGFKFPRVSPAALRNPNAPLDPGPGGEFVTVSTFTYQPTNELRASLSFTKDRLRRYDTGRVAFDSNIFALRTTYQFTRFTFARARIDYDTLRENIRGQFLVGWTPNPGTSFYVGYNDDINRNGINAITGQFEPGLSRNTRTFFIKMSYLFRRSL